RAEVATSLALGIPIGSAIRNVCFQMVVIAIGAALLSITLLPVAGPLLYENIKVINAPYWLSYHFKWNYVGMVLAVAGVSATVTVISPVVYLLWVDPDRVISEHTYASRGTGRTLWRRLLLTGQIALLTVLGVSSGLLVCSSYNAGENNWGYPADQVFVGKISVAAIKVAEERVQGNLERLAIFRRVLDQIEQRPETAAAALANFSPGYSGDPAWTYNLGQEEIGEALFKQVTEGFFDALDVPFVEGKMFPRESPDDGTIYAVINESLARKIWPAESPLQRILYLRFNRMPEIDIPVIVSGVVRDFQANGPVARTNDFIFIPFIANYYGVSPVLNLFVRDRAGLPNVQSLRDAVHRADPRISLYFPSTIAKTIDLMLSSMHMTANLTTVFAVAAVLLCAIGVYSLTVTQVLQSSRDFGIRMALGTEPHQLWVHFTRGHLLTTLVGVLIGLVGASQVARLFGALLFGVDPYSISTYAIVAFTILLVAALACIPSFFRLKRINPAECLRSL
ncbi:MAG: FtsX-like permease family protein, partial [Opitutaceae bacterium]|nr:FtsX-like permease family protein [Opitutaceae bacterium]